MRTMELTKNDSKMLQGLSVLAMVCLHLFDRDYSGLFTPLIYIGGVPLSFYFAQLSDFCVFGFAFLSGYAHMIQYERVNFYKQRLKKLLSLFCTYWLIMILFSVISLGVGMGDYMPGSPMKFVLNALTIESSYNGAWWYMFSYTILVFASPLIMKWIKQSNLLGVMGIGFLTYCIAYYIRFKLGYSNWLLGKIGPFGMTLFEYMLGAVAFKYGVFCRMGSLLKRIPKLAAHMISIAIVGLMLYVRTKVVPSLFVAPITGFIIITIFHFWNKPEFVKQLFLLIGKHSTVIWLTHMFFYLHLFKNLVYVAKYPLPIYIVMLAITMPLSMIFKLIERPIQNQIARI